jgi:hydrogenase small subunit
MSGAMPLMDPHRNTPLHRQPYSVAGSWDTGDGNGKIERSIAEVMEWLGTSSNCLGIIAFGTCASFGGIPAGYGNQTAATGLYNFFVNFLGYSELAGKIINCPGCAPHPDWMIFPVAYFLLTGTIPPLDDTIVRNRVWLGQQQVFTNEIPKNTPRAIYTADKGYTYFCQVCEKYSQDKLCTDLGAGPGQGFGLDGSDQKEFCTRPVGCNGFMASPDCPTRRWNNFDDHSPNSWCVGANYVCQGCAEVDFPDGRSPFFTANKNGTD